MASAPGPKLSSQLFPCDWLNKDETKASQTQDPIPIAIFFGGLALTALVLTKTIRAVYHLWPCMMQFVGLLLTSVQSRTTNDATLRLYK